VTVTCQACGFASPEPAAFCGRCGSALGTTCPACGAGPFEPELRFCTTCGTELTQPDATAERKVVTVLFVDLVGFTAMSEKLDPEDVQRVLGPYYETARTQLARYGGTVEKFIGDAVMALFGAPVAHEDDPERAVRAAWAVCQAVRQVPGPAALPALHVRIGITTGEAIVLPAARLREGEAMAHGDVVNTAARLQAQAPVDGILVDERTYRATRFMIDFRAASPVQARGKSEPVPVWEVVAPRARLGIDRYRHQRRIVDRKDELEAMTAALERAAEGGASHQVVLSGPAGIGKSRLVWELFQHVDRSRRLVYWRQGRSLPYGDGVTFWALAEIVKAQAGILATDSSEAVRQKLRLAVEDVIADRNDAEWIEGHLAPLAGLPAARELRGENRAEAFSAWRRFLEGLAARRPLVLVFEDLHWADDGLLDFISDQLGDRFQRPLVVVGTCRPDLLERRPDWERPSATLLELEPLSEEDTGHLVADLLGGGEAPDELRSLVIARTGGNALYAEEYVRMLLDRGLLEESEGSWALNASDVSLPDSVQAIIAARLDALPADLKRLLQDASVVGKGFWLDALAAVGGYGRSAAEARVRDLERKQLVRREHDSIVRGEPQYAFFHDVVRDVTHAQIPRAVRAEKHQRAAEWIESLAADRSEDHAEMLAHQYLTALGFAQAAGEPTEVLTERTRLALRDVGDRAFSLTDFSKAARFYSEALDLWPPEAPERADLLFSLGRAELHADGTGGEALAEARGRFLAAGLHERAAEATVLLGELHWMRGDPEALEYLEEAAALLADASPSPTRTYVISNLARFRMIHSEYGEAIRQGREALGMAKELGLGELRAHALASIGLARTRSGDAGGLADLEESVALAVSANSIESVRGYANLGNALIEQGNLAPAFELHEKGRIAAARFGDADRIRWFDEERIYELYWRGLWVEAAELADEAVAGAVGGRPTTLEEDARLVRSRIRLARGDSDGAVSDSLRTVELGRRAGYPEMIVPALALQARVTAAAGKTADGEAAVAELLELWPHRAPSSYWLADLAFAADQLGRCEAVLDALARVGGTSRWADAARAFLTGDFAQAAQLYSEIGSIPDEAFTRLCSARASLDGRDDLAQALAVFRSLGAEAYVREGEALVIDG
jgi:class 3 adenylate cyclase/tetratricopeptide (TPR) repeat protein